MRCFRSEPAREWQHMHWKKLVGEVPIEHLSEGTNEVRRCGNFYVKFPGMTCGLDDVPPDLQLVVEHLAYRIYRCFRVKVPAAHLVHDDCQLGLATRKINGPPLGGHLRSRNCDLDELKRLGKAADVYAGFFVDVLLANWDVIGQTGDNLILAADGIYRIDPGGALTFRASGDRKGEAFGDFPGELTSMKDASVGTAGRVFGPMPPEHEQHAVGVFRAVEWLALRDVIEEARAALAAEARQLEQRDPDSLIQAVDAEFALIASKLEVRRGAILSHLAGDGANR